MLPIATPIALAALASVLAVAPAHAAPVTMRYPEGPTHGFVTVSELGGKVVAHGELEQWLEKHVVANSLVLTFDDGSVYDERVRFTQRPAFRIRNYRLVQRGPSFPETLDVELDASGRYRAKRRAAPDAKEEESSGTFEVPADLGNGLTGTLLKNLEPGASAKTTLVAFLPEPLVLEMDLTPEGTDPYRFGRVTGTATRYRAHPIVPGIKGFFAKLLGKEPPTLHFWVIRGKAPLMTRFEGPLVAGGPVLRIEVASPSIGK